MIGKSAGELLANNYFYENLNDECAIKDVSWIKPGKVIREVTLTTQGGLACVDFAAENGLQYVEFDAGWYGPENDDSSDAATVTVDPNTWQHSHVFRGVLTANEGNDVDLTSSEKYTLVQFKGVDISGMKINDMKNVHIAAFINMNSGASTPSGLDILNAQEADLNATKKWD